MEDEVKERHESEIRSQDAEQDTEDLLARARARAAELEQTLAARDSEIAGLKQSHAGVEAKLNDLSGSLAEAVAGYRHMVVQANPDVPPELISGETVAVVAESLKQAKALVGKVREGLEAELSRTRFPAGAPERAPGSLDLSPREKIQQAISRGK